MDSIESKHRSILNELTHLRTYGFVECIQSHNAILSKLIAAAHDANQGGNVKSFLLKGPRGCGKTSIAASVGILCDFPHILRISPETFLNFIDEQEKSRKIAEVAAVVKQQSLSLLIIDDIDSLLGYSSLLPVDQFSLPQYSHVILDTLVEILNSPEVKQKVMVVGTTTHADFLSVINRGLLECFSETVCVGGLGLEDVKTLLAGLGDFNIDAEEIPSIAESILARYGPEEVPVARIFDVLKTAKSCSTEGKVTLANVVQCVKTSYKNVV